MELQRNYNEIAMKLQWIHCNFIVIYNEITMELQWPHCNFIVIYNEITMKLQRSLRKQNFRIVFSLLSPF